MAVAVMTESIVSFLIYNLSILLNFIMYSTTISEYILKYKAKHCCEKQLLFTVINKLIEYNLYLFNLNTIVS